MKKLVVVLLSMMTVVTYASNRVDTVKAKSAHQKPVKSGEIQQHLFDQAYLKMTTVRPATHSAVLTTRAAMIATRVTLVG